MDLNQNGSNLFSLFYFNFFLLCFLSKITVFCNGFLCIIFCILQTLKLVPDEVQYTPNVGEYKLGTHSHVQTLGSKVMHTSSMYTGLCYCECIYMVSLVSSVLSRCLFLLHMWFYFGVCVFSLLFSVRCGCVCLLVWSYGVFFFKFLFSFYCYKFSQTIPFISHVTRQIPNTHKISILREV